MKNYTLPQPVPHFYQIEVVFTYKQLKTFVDTYWHFTLYIAIIYVTTIHSLKYYMKFRPAFSLRYLAIFWNAIFALFSICCTIRGIPVLRYAIVNSIPFYQIICNREIYLQFEAALTWAFLFMLSKILELGDTIIIVLRKRKLLLVHWYHHMTTMILIWYGAHKELVFGYVVCYINVVVHSFMYSYFVLKFLDIKIPKKVAMFITTIQIMQMFYEFLVLLWVYWLLLNDYECDASKDVLEYMILVAFTYLFLFGQLFYNSYLKPLNNIKKNV